MYLREFDALANMPKTLILAGGLGTRLRDTIGEVPKALATPSQMPFLELQLKWLWKQKIENVVVLAGYKAREIKLFLEERRSPGPNTSIIVEEEQLGTGGAILNAISLLGAEEDFIVINGDTLADLNLFELVDFGKIKNGASLASMFVDDTSRFGKIRWNSDKVLTGFEEKSKAKSKGFVNLAMYYFPKKWFISLQGQEQKCSLEKDLFPYWIDKGHQIYVKDFQGDFIDIGTPESYVEFCSREETWLQNLLG